MHKIALVAKETYRRQAKTWSFLLMILSPFIFFIITFFINSVSNNKSTSSDESRLPIAVISKTSNIKKSFDQDRTFTDKYKTNMAAKKAVKTKKVAGYLVIKQHKHGQLYSTYYSNKPFDQTSKQKVTQKLTNLQKSINLTQAKLTAKQINQLSQQPKIQEKITVKKTKSHDNQKSYKYISFYILLFIMYFLLLAYSTITAQEIATEKGTKIMEVIFSSMPAAHYFYGKVIGILGLILTQILVYIGGGAIFYVVAPHINGVSKIFNSFKSVIDTIISNILSWNLLFVLLALILYVIYSALCGALVIRSEDAHKSVQPVIYLILAGFFMAFYFSNNSANFILKIFSYIPFLSSFLMPIRVILENISGLEIGASLLILIAFTVGSFVYIGKIYPRLILQTDDIGFLKVLKRGLHKS